jgi:hypothetical protein
MNFLITVSFPDSSSLLPPKERLYMKFFVAVVIHVIAELNAACDLPKKSTLNLIRYTVKTVK